MKKVRIVIALLVLLGAASLAEAQIVVSSTTASTTHVKAEKPKSGRAKGWVFRPEGTIGGSVGGKSLSLVKLHGTFDYQFNPYFSIGVGTGMSYVFSGDWSIPLPYANARAYFCDRKWSPFFNLRTGIYIPLTLFKDLPLYSREEALEGISWVGTLGMQHNRFDFGISGGVYYVGEFYQKTDTYMQTQNSAAMIVEITVAYNIPFKKK